MLSVRVAPGSQKKLSVTSHKNAMLEKFFPINCSVKAGVTGDLYDSDNNPNPSGGSNAVQMPCTCPKIRLPPNLAGVNGPIVVVFSKEESICMLGQCEYILIPRV